MTAKEYYIERFGEDLSNGDKLAIAFAQEYHQSKLHADDMGGAWKKYCNVKYSPSKECFEAGWNAAMLHKQEWISVEDRLPKKKGYYCTLTTEEEYGILLWNDRWYFDEYQDEKLLIGIKSEFITHWMYLPNKPQDK